MARLNYIPTFIGTVGPVTFYRMYDWFYVRSRSSLTAKRVKKDPAFRKFMQFADLLATASPIASAVYAIIPKERKVGNLFKRLNGEVMTWLKYRWTKEAIIEYLTHKYAGKLPACNDGAVTRLRADYRVRRIPVHDSQQDDTASISNDSLPGLVKNTAREHLAFELHAWRRRDRAFRREYYKTFRDYDWRKQLKRQTYLPNTLAQV